jgi:hypothetical protein
LRRPARRYLLQRDKFHLIVPGSSNRTRGEYWL